MYSGDNSLQGEVVYAMMIIELYNFFEHGPSRLFQFRQAGLPSIIISYFSGDRQDTNDLQ